MNAIYTICFVVGGVFVALGAIAGLDGVEFGIEFDPDLELKEGTTADGSQASDARSHWLQTLVSLPFSSLKFWTFGSCFFGLSGLVLSRLNPGLPGTVVFLVAIAVGLLCGSAIAWILRYLQRSQADSLVRPEDLMGRSAIVEIPFDRDSKGKVNLKIKGTSLSLSAYTDSDRAFSRGDRTFIIGMKNSTVWVVPSEEGE
ncbi:NfeD-like protein [Oxynema aestuarii]|uniref:NfeD-like protein n=1 Tax=Oxynema aestuarii AP17 TaxID=2064643 RepID=A0A6H1U2F6_9CYAN|nr:NfeD-like protein [Oxynema aestuarii]QIZ72213.1 NfeD-like protein [Oxynema aestuarii AP17]RMH75172.1 MAG: NfeD-like protein [Cyanobacteria bacterium J007]